MGAITSLNVANAIVKLVAADALPVLVGNLVMGNLVNRDYEPVLAHAGNTINVPIPPTMVANNILEGASVVPQSPNMGNAQIVLNQHVESTFQIPDVVKVLAVPDLLKVYLQPAVAAIAQRIETDLLNLYGGFTLNAPVGTAGVAITEAVVDSAETALFLAKAPPLEQKYMVVDANTYSAWPDSSLQRISEFGRSGFARHCRWHHRQSKGLLRISLAVCGEDRKQPGKHSQSGVHEERRGFGDAALAAAAPGTGAIAEYAEMGNFGMRVVMSYQPNTLAQQFTVDVLYGCGVLRNELGIQVNT